MYRIENINISVIVPVYNVEDYLPECIDSLLQQSGLCFEIILVDDGSTDNSRAIIDQFAKKDNRIKVIHQGNSGASAARNTGMKLAQGEYIAFIDSDDWIKKNSLHELYCEAIKYQVDVVMGNLLDPHQNRIIDGLFQPIPKEIRYIPFSGKEGFIRLSEANAFIPMAWNYIYSRIFLEKIQARFEEGIIHEDELWSPVILCQAPKMVITGTDFYYYRQTEKSVMHTTNIQHRLKSLFRVTDKLMEFAGQFDFTSKDSELKNWLYAVIFRNYSMAFRMLPALKDVTYILPRHHLDRFWRDCWEMLPEPQKVCKKHFLRAEVGLRMYINWIVTQ
jgi:glycosyltransferase involved in cell wall biosynthesis